MSTFRFAFLILEEHPYGREMLHVLMQNGFNPSIIIQEVSEVGDLEREKFLARMSGYPIAPRITQLVAGKNIPIYCVGNHNDASSKALLEADAPEVVVLGGTRIIKPAILGIPKRGTVNAHPGLLPWLRGSASVGWALYKDMKIGATVHFIDPGIDTGDIILRRELPVYRSDTYESLNYRIATLSGELMAETLNFFTQDNLPRIPQDPSLGETYKVIPEELLEEAKQRLAAGLYSHFAPEHPDGSKE
jgi:methionyl-tRNA formyltransferase